MKYSAHYAPKRHFQKYELHKYTETEISVMPLQLLSGCMISKTHNFCSEKNFMQENGIKMLKIDRSLKAKIRNFVNFDVFNFFETP